MYKRQARRAATSPWLRHREDRMTASGRLLPYRARGSPAKARLDDTRHIDAEGEEAAGVRLGRARVVGQVLARAGDEGGAQVGACLLYTSRCV